MKKYVMLTAAAAMALCVGVPATASAQKNAKTPDNWSYEIKNGKRVPKSNRVTQPDGSWVEEIKQGNCTVTRTGKAGEVRETRKCG